MSIISDFIEKTNKLSFAFSNLYSVEIPSIPDKITSRSLIETTSLLCNSAQLPGTTIATTEKALDFRSRGKQRVYDDVTLNFYCSENMQEFIFFNDWMNEIIDPVTNRVQFFDGYVNTITINKLSKTDILSPSINRQSKNETVLKTILYEAYPKRIEPITLEYSASGSVSTMSVTFAYTWHVHYPSERVIFDTEKKEEPRGNVSNGRLV